MYSSVALHTSTTLTPSLHFSMANNKASNDHVIPIFLPLASFPADRYAVRMEGLVAAAVLLFSLDTMSKIN